MEELATATMTTMAEDGQTTDSTLVADTIVGAFRLSIAQLRSCMDNGFDLRIDAKLGLLKLRECNRSLSVLLRNKKKRVQQAKNALDRTELTRQNLLYKKNHLLASIEDTRRHPSFYESIMLVDVQETAMDIDEHTMMLHRLREELETRKQLAERLKSNQDSLELAKSRLVLKRKELEKVRDQVESILKACDPLLHTHSRLFAELKQRGMPEMKSPMEEMSTMSKGSPLEVLMSPLLKWAEGPDDITVQMFDELEPGEEEAEFDTNNGGEVDEDEPATPISTEDGSGNNRSHARFVPSSQLELKNRKFAFAHIRVQLGETATVYFFAVSAANLIVCQVEIPSRSMEKAELESFMLSLPNLDPSMLLTISHEAITHGETGFVPFKWIQCLAGLVPSESAYEDSNTLLQNFFSSVRSAATSSTTDEV